MLRWGGPVLLGLTLLALWLFADRWWPLLPLLYGPRWMLTPLALTPLLAHRRGSGRGTLLALATGVAIAALLVDFRTGWRRLIPDLGQSATPFRVISWNAQGGGDNATASVLQLARAEADLIVIAECSAKLHEALRSLLEMELHRSASLCLATVHPTIEWAPRSPRDFWRAGGSGAIARLIINANGIEVVVGAVHLETPRDALDELEVFPINQFRDATVANQELRDVESAAARSWIAPPHDEIRPVVIAGDFNIPVESAIYRRWWGDLGNAFSATGIGLGWTKRTEWLGVRIDHVLMGNGVTARTARLGPAMGSDHRPVITDLRIPETIVVGSQ